MNGTGKEERKVANTDFVQTTQDYWVQIQILRKINGTSRFYILK